MCLIIKYGFTNLSLKLYPACSAFFLTFSQATERDLALSTDASQIALSFVVRAKVSHFSGDLKGHLIPSQVIPYKTTWANHQNAPQRSGTEPKDTTQIRNCVRNPPLHHLRQENNHLCRRGFPEHCSFTKITQKSHKNAIKVPHHCIKQSI